MNKMKVKNKIELKAEIQRAIVKYGNEVDLNYIDTSQITDMIYLFYDFPDFNGKIENWDTSNVKSMTAMFEDAENFNQPLNFDTSKVTDMSRMFQWAENFNQPLNFDTSKVKNMTGMFEEAKNFNQKLNFNTSNVRNMRGMFYYAENFNQPLNFDTSKVTDMSCMFYEAKKFSQPLNFDTSKVTDMSFMFYGSKGELITKTKIMKIKKTEELILKCEEQKERIAKLKRRLQVKSDENFDVITELNEVTERLRLANCYLRENPIILFSNKQF